MPLQKEEENWLEQDHPSYDCTSSQQHDKQQEREERTCLVQVWAVAFIYLEFSRWDSCTFSQGFRRFSENLRWPYRDKMATVIYMGNCAHFRPGTTFNSVIWTELKVVPG